MPELKPHETEEFENFSVIKKKRILQIQICDIMERMRSVTKYTTHRAGFILGTITSDRGRIRGKEYYRIKVWANTNQAFTGFFTLLGGNETYKNFVKLPECEGMELVHVDELHDFNRKLSSECDKLKSLLKRLKEEENSKCVLSAGGVVINPHGEVLIVNQRGNSWSLPKGKIDEGENEEAAARREIYEESGVSDLTLVQRMGEYKRKRISRDGSGEDRKVNKSITFFHFTSERTDSLTPIDPHNPEARWVNKNKVADMLSHPRDKAFFRISVLPLLK